MLYVLMCLDKSDANELRLKTRDAHLAYVKSMPGKVRLAGALLADDETTMIGSLLVVDAESKAEAEAWSQNDPYRQAGLFESVDIKPWNWTVGAPQS